MAKAKDWKKYERHPLSALYEDLCDWEHEDMKDGLEEHGILNGRKITLLDGMVLDGWQMYTCCVELDLEPTFQKFPKNKKPDDFVKTMNDIRRHEPEEVRKARRQKRIERVAAAKEEGQTTREIAEQAGVSESQVRRDLDESKDKDTSAPQGAEKPSDLPSETHQNSPKNHPPKDSQILCVGCQRRSRKGQDLPRNCPDCKELRKGGNGQVKEEPKVEEAVPVKDAEGHIVPGGCVEAFVNLAKFEELQTLCRQMQKGIDELVRLSGGEQLRRCVQTTSSGENTIYKSQHLNELKRDIKGYKPHSVCPWCKGKKKDCQKCDQTGWVSKLTWDNAEEKVRAKLS